MDLVDHHAAVVRVSDVQDQFFVHAFAVNVYVTDKALGAQHVGDRLPQLGSRTTRLSVPCSPGVSNSGQHVADRISHHGSVALCCFRFGQSCSRRPEYSCFYLSTTNDSLLPSDYCPALLSKRHPQMREQCLAFRIRARGCHHGDVHSRDSLHRVVVYFGEDNLLANTEGVVAPAVKGLG